MSIEAGARAGMIAPDETTVAYLAGRPRAPSGAAWDRAVARWRELRTDPGATRSEEHTSELQSQSNLVCRLLLEKKKRDTERSCLCLVCVCITHLLIRSVCGVD